MAKEISFYLQKSGASPADSQDIAQDILVKILEADIVLPYDKLRAWLYRTAIRVYIDKYRRDKRYHEILQRDFFQQEQLAYFDQGDYDWVREELDHLSPIRRAVLDLHYFQGFSVGEIAQILGVSISKVKKDLERGRSQLKETLEKAGYQDGNI